MAKQSKPVHQIDTQSNSSSDDYDTVFTLEVADVHAINSNKWFSRMKLCKEIEVDFQLDCGATVSILPMSDFCRITRAPKLQETETVLKMYNGTKIWPVGKINCKTLNPKNGRKYIVEYYIVKESCKPILGVKTAEAMGLIAIKRENVMAI